MMDLPVEKICRVCGRDVRGMRRTKDPRGNYYCAPCYNDLLEVYNRRMMVQASPDMEPPVPLEAPAALEAAAAAAGAASIDAPRRAFSIGQAFSLAAGKLAALKGAGRHETEPRVHAVAVHKRVQRPSPRRRTHGSALRLSDLIGDEAQAEVVAARENPRSSEPEIPVSPITNLPVSAMIRHAEYPSPEPFVAPSDDDHGGAFDGHTFADVQIASPAMR